MNFRYAMLRAIKITPLILSGHALAAQVDCSLPDNRFGISQGSVFNITTSGFTSSDVATAIAYWSGCAGYGNEIPTLQVGGSGGIPVSIIKQTGKAPLRVPGCGESSIQPSNGQIAGAIITVWTKENDGDTCEPLTDTIAHEFGHLFALTDNGSSACIGHIMGSRIAGGTRSVQSDDCAIADDKWETPSEAVPDPDPYCEVYCWTSCVYNQCPALPPGQGCPVVVDVEDDGIHLTGLDDPVWFDIDADGDQDLMSWTDRSEGLLALDRNGNGMIDDGGELFGNATRLVNGIPALNGYQALAELDSWTFGGNGDGRIDSADPSYGHLRLWMDENHDGLSQPAELVTYKRSRDSHRFGLQAKQPDRPLWKRAQVSEQSVEGYAQWPRTSRSDLGCLLRGGAVKARYTGSEAPSTGWRSFLGHVVRTISRALSLA